MTSTAMNRSSRRREMDVMKLMMTDWKVEIVEDNISEFYVLFRGPCESPYEGGYWKIHVELPEGYPYKSPSIGFVNKIYHPNVDEMAGSVCLDVINQTWSPMFDLINVFEVFLPQLLLYPNASDPLNGEAASMLMKEPQKYNEKVKEYVKRYAKEEDIVMNPANVKSNSTKSKSSTKTTSKKAEKKEEESTALEQRPVEDEDEGFLTSSSDSDSDVE
eukprot:g3356.t1